jgi:hypothetical protein
VQDGTVPACICRSWQPRAEHLLRCEIKSGWIHQWLLTVALKGNRSLCSGVAYFFRDHLGEVWP